MGPKAEYGVLGYECEGESSYKMGYTLLSPNSCRKADLSNTGQDMSSMSLPDHGSQDRLISAVAEVNSNVIFINSTGVPIDMPWLPSISAMLHVWFEGQESVNSIADVLFGFVNLSGKLPVRRHHLPKESSFVHVINIILAVFPCYCS